MTRHLLLVASAAVDGQEDEYHRWYDEVHLPDVLSVPGFVRATRYAAVPSVHGELPALPFLAVYEVETDDLAGTLAALRSAARDMELSPAFDRQSSTQLAFTALGPPREAT